jgi:hypothetical protein
MKTSQRKIVFYRVRTWNKASIITTSPWRAFFHAMKDFRHHGTFNIQRTSTLSSIDI